MMSAESDAADDTTDAGLFEELYRENPEAFEAKAQTDDPDAWLAQLVIDAYGGEA